MITVRDSLGKHWWLAGEAEAKMVAYELDGSVVDDDTLAGAPEVFPEYDIPVLNELAAAAGWLYDQPIPARYGSKQEADLRRLMPFVRKAGVTNAELAAAMRRRQVNVNKLDVAKWDEGYPTRGRKRGTAESSKRVAFAANAFIEDDTVETRAALADAVADWRRVVGFDHPGDLRIGRGQHGIDGMLRKGLGLTDADGVKVVWKTDAGVIVRTDALLAALRRVGHPEIPTRREFLLMLDERWQTRISKVYPPKSRKRLNGKLLVGATT